MIWANGIYCLVVYGLSDSSGAESDRQKVAGVKRPASAEHLPGYKEFSKHT